MKINLTPSEVSILLDFEFCFSEKNYTDEEHLAAQLVLEALKREDTEVNRRNAGSSIIANDLNITNPEESTASLT